MLTLYMLAKYFIHYLATTGGFFFLEARRCNVVFKD